MSEPTQDAAKATSESGAKSLQISQDDLKKMLTETAEATAKAIRDEADKKTDPQTRPEWLGGGESTDEKGDVPGLSDVESDHIVAVKKLIPPGAIKATTLDRGAESFYKGVNINSFPRGEVKDNFSALRLAYAAQHAQSDPSAWRKYAPWENSYYEAVRKAQAESNGQDGGFLAPEEWRNELFGILRPASILEKLPIRRINMGTRVTHMPKVVGDVTIGYGAENAALTASTFQYAQVSFTARKQYAFVQVSNEVLRDSLPSIEDSIRMEAAIAIARDRDKQALLGNGQGGAPVGLINQTNVTSGNLGATPTYANLHTGILNVRNLNSSTNVPVGQANCTGIVASVQLENTIAQLKDSQNRPLWAYGIGQIGRIPGAGFLGVDNWVFSNLIAPGNSAQVIYGDFQYMILMERQDVEIQVSNVAGTAFANDQTWYRLIYRYDVGVMHPEAFFVHTNAQP